MGLGVAWTTTSMVGAVINKWFKKNKGTVLGAVLASNGVGAAVAIQITTPIIYQEGNPFGYQDSYHLVALILAVVAVIIMIIYKWNSIIILIIYIPFVILLNVFYEAKIVF